MRVPGNGLGRIIIPNPSPPPFSVPLPSTNSLTVAAATCASSISLVLGLQAEKQEIENNSNKECRKFTSANHPETPMPDRHWLQTDDPVHGCRPHRAGGVGALLILVHHRLVLGRGDVFAGGLVMGEGFNGFFILF